MDMTHSEKDPFTSDFSVGCLNAARNKAMVAAKTKRKLFSGSLSVIIFRNRSSSNTPVSRYCTTTAKFKRNANYYKFFYD